MRKIKAHASIILLGLTAVPGIAFGQSGRSITPPPTPMPVAQEPQRPSAPNNLDKVKFIRSNGFDNFIKQLNELGKSGYKIEKSLNFGGEGVSQTFAAVLFLGEGNTYEYDWLSSPNKNFLESRLNNRAKKGFTVANSFALTVCDRSGSENDKNESIGEALILRLQKGDVFLLERKNSAATQTREYRVLIGKIGPGKSPTEAIQASLDSIPPGFRPIKILFSKSGLIDFAVSVLLEKVLGAENSPKIEYKFVKDINGFEKGVNALAAQGYRIISGRRIGLVKFVLMTKEITEPTVYTFIDEEKYARDFNKTVAEGNRYQGITGGDLTCDSTQVANEKILFVRNENGKQFDYKILQMNDQTSDEFKKLLADNYQIRDLFFLRGLNIIFEK